MLRFRSALSQSRASTQAFPSLTPYLPGTSIWLAKRKRAATSVAELTNGFHTVHLSQLIITSGSNCLNS